MRTPRALPALLLLAGLLLFDILMNLPGFSLSSPLASVLLPSIDLLVIIAACMGIAQARERARLPLRIAVSVLAVIMLACSAGLRFGFDIEARLFGGGPGVAAGWAVSLVLLAGAGGAAFLLSGLLVGGLEAPIPRNVVLLLIAIAAVLHVVTGRRLFSASVIPRIIAIIGNQAR
ncbi:MAG: hypothetical protein ABSG21_00110 [Spirochaetia bacterium]|jgi:hypothetical protein